MAKYKIAGAPFLLSIACMAGFLVEGAWAVTQIQSIDFKNGPDGSVLEIQADGPVSFTKTEIAGDKQVVLELSGVTLGANASRPLDTSSFESPVKLVSPFQVEGQPENARIVMQLNEMAATDVTQDGNILRVKIAGTTPPPAASTAEGVPPEATPDAMAALDPAAPPAPAPGTKADQLNEFLRSQNTQRFVGKPINLQLRDADLVDVFRLIGETSGFNIVVGDDVKGHVTLSLSNVPWDQALDMILRTNKLGAERNNNILRIASLENLVQERNQQLQAKLAVEASAPRMTRVFQVSYANLTELQKVLVSFGSGPGSASGGASSAMVQADARTNTIIVRDTLENIEKMKKLIELLDTQTPQVLIEARIVEASEKFTRTLGGQLGVGSSSVLWGATFNGGGIEALAGSAFTSGTTSSLLGTSLDLSIIPGFSRLNALLNIGENENKLKTVSSPRTVVLNKQTASITQVEGVTVPVVTNTVGAGSTSSFSQLNANISLSVTPTITNDGSVLMDLNVSRDVTDIDPATQINMVLPRNIRTQVLVESGSTLSIGGVYSRSKNESGSGFPFLRRIPIIGWLFGGESKTERNSELFFFITPRILNPRDIGAVKT